MAETSKEIQFILSAKNKTAAALLEFENSVKRATDKVNDRMNDATRATDAHAKSTSRLTEFYKEQRSEDRLMNFYMRESKDAIGATALVLTGFSAASGQGSEAMKRLNSALQEGFVAFQGIDFALAGLGAGPWGVVAAGAVGVAAAISSFGQNAETSKAKIELLQNQLSRGFVGMGPNEVESSIKNVQAALEKLRAEQKQLLKDGKGYPMIAQIYDSMLGKFDAVKAAQQQQIDENQRAIELNMANLTVLQGMQETAAQKAIRLEQERQAALDATTKATLRNEDQRIKRQIETMRALQPEAVKQLELQLSIMNALKEQNSETGKKLAHDQLSLQIAESEKKMREGIVQAQRLNKPHETLSDTETTRASQAIQDAYDQMSMSGAKTAQFIASSMQSASDVMVDAFMTGTLKVEELFQSMFANLLKMFLQQYIFRGLFAMIFPGLGAAEAVPGIAGAGNVTRPAQFAPMRNTSALMGRTQVVQVHITTDVPDFRNRVFQTDMRRTVAQAVQSAIMMEKG